MKSRLLETVPLVVVSNYKIQKTESGKYLHSFTPESTHTLYQFEGNREPLLVSGGRYSIAFSRYDGKNWVDVSAIARADDVSPSDTYKVSRLHGESIRAIEVRKSLERVTIPGRKSSDGYLGRKYAWRIYGMSLARDTFDQYLESIGHPSTFCLTDGSPSTAYEEAGIEEEMKTLFKSLVHVSGNRYSSPLLPQKPWFQVKGLSAITDKK